MFIFGREASSSERHPSSFTSATPSTQLLTRVSSITSSSTAKPQRSTSEMKGTEHSQIRRKEHSGSSQSQTGTSSRRSIIQEGTNISAKEIISIYEEGNEFEGKHLSFHGQGAWRGPPSSNPASPSRTPSPSSSSSSMSSTQSGREFRGSGDSGAVVVIGPSGAVQTLSDSRRPLFCIFWSERHCADGV